VDTFVWKARVTAVTARSACFEVDCPQVFSRKAKNIDKEGGCVLRNKIQKKNLHRFFSFIPAWFFQVSPPPAEIRRSSGIVNRFRRQ
jgi:hypothetical protein